MPMLLFTLTALAATERYNASDIRISEMEVKREGETLKIRMGVDASQLKLKSNQELIIRPSVASLKGSCDSLPPIIVAGRNRYYYHLRNNDEAAAGGRLYHNGSLKGDIPYAASLPFEEWMDNSQIALTIDSDGCCGESDGPTVLFPVAGMKMRKETMASNVADILKFIAPADSGIKTRAERGSALIDFRINDTVINADFGRNPVELAKIVESIQKVSGDDDLSITGVSIKGFASPEGPYANNERLARGRSNSLVEYVRRLYDFPESVSFRSSWEAEDWEGLRAAVESSGLDEREGLLAVIDSGLPPDERDARLRTLFPQQYKWLLNVVYPSLRHSDYEITYVVRDFSDVTEILAVMRENPSKLSLNELFVAANSFPPGSEEFNEVFGIAVRMYPEDETANLNAANMELRRGRRQNAWGFLARSGESPEAYYTRAVAAAMAGDYDRAEDYLGKSPGVEEARTLAERIKRIKENDGDVVLTPL